jgi:hypothetical protein
MMIKHYDVAIVFKNGYRWQGLVHARRYDLAVQEGIFTVAKELIDRSFFPENIIEVSAREA